MTLKNAINKRINRSLLWITELLVHGFILVLNQFQSQLKTIGEIYLQVLGINVNGNDPWDIQVKDNRFYPLLFAKSISGLADAYYSDYIDCENLEECLYRVSKVGFNYFVFYYHPYKISKELIHRWFDVLNEENSYETISQHYDDKSEFTFKDILSASRQYSAPLFDNQELVEFKSSDEIDEFIENNALKTRELYARKLKLKPGMRVLDIGCGFGHLAKHLAENYNVHVTGVTLSHDMAEHAKKACKGFDVDIHRMDYRGIRGKFDRIVCIEMFCHVGEHHQREFFEHVHDWLKDDGLVMMHTVSVNHRFSPSYDPFFEDHLNFYAHMSRPEEIIKHSTGLFIIEDWRNYGYHFGLTGYYGFMKTKMACVNSFRDISEKSKRKVLMYFGLISAAGRSRKLQLYAIILSKNGFNYAYDY